MRLSLRIGLLAVGFLLGCGKDASIQRDAGASDGINPASTDGSTTMLDAPGAGGSGGSKAADAGGDASAEGGGTAGTDAGAGLGGSTGIGGVGGGAGGTNVQSTGGSLGVGGSRDAGGPDVPAKADAPGTGGIAADAPIGGSATGGAGGSPIDARPDLANGGQSGGGGAGTTATTGGTGGANCGAPAGPASNLCWNIACTQPPADACVNGTTLRHYDADGICMRGDCKYAYRDIPCAGGCAGGICQGEACGAITCNTPPAAACSNTSTWSVPAPLGVCSSNACSYAAAQITCTNACSGSGCTADDTLSENVVVEHVYGTPAPAFVLDSGNQPRLAWCEKGVLHYRYRGATGWQTIDVETDATLDTDCGVVLALDASDRARLAYGNKVAKTLRFAEETAPGTFTIVTPVYNDVYGLALASMPSGEPAIAYVAGPYYGRTLSFVSRNGASWKIENVLGPPTYNSVEELTQMVIAADGTVHLVNGRPSKLQYLAGSYSDVSYSRRVGTTWDVRFIKESAHSGRGLVLDAQGKPTILAMTHTSGSHFCDILWTFADDGTALPGERVMCDGGGGALLPDVYGTMRADSRFRLAFEIWVPVGEVGSPVGLQVGSDSIPRYLVAKSTISTEQDAVVRSPCRPKCEDRDCGPDGCGGVCGVCAGCATCSESGHCNAVPSERVTRLPGQPIPTANPTIGGVVPTPDGRIMVWDSTKTTAQLGTTGQWGQTVSLPAGASLLSGGGQLYSLKGSKTSSTYHGDISRWDGTAWPSFASVEITGYSSFSVRVDGGSNLHFIYIDPGDAVTNPQRVMHLSVSSSGTVGQPEVLFSTQTPNNWATVEMTSVVAGAANELHYTYKYGKRPTADPAFVYEYRHGVTGIGSWPQTTAPTGMKFADGVVDAQGTLYVRMDPVSPPTIGSTSAYATRKSNGQWTFPTMTGNAFTTHKMLASRAPLFGSPKGDVFSFVDGDPHPVYYKLDTAADTWTQIAAGIGDGYLYHAFDTQGVLHLFAIQSVSSVEHLWHWWFTPP